MQTVREGMQFLRGIGAAVLWGACGWNRCSEPSQALRASSPGGRAKSLVGVDRWRERQGLGGCRWTVGEPRAWWVSMDGETASMVLLGAFYLRVLALANLLLGCSCRPKMWHRTRVKTIMWVGSPSYSSNSSSKMGSLPFAPKSSP